jgi:hypothetical protein
MKIFEQLTFLLPAILSAVLLIAGAARAQGGSIVVLSQNVRFPLIPFILHVKKSNREIKSEIHTCEALLKLASVVTLICPQNFTNFINNATPIAFVSFYKQPNLAFSAFSEASARFSSLGADPPIVFAQVDVVQNPTLASKFNATNADITTLTWFTKGNPDRQPYNGVSLQADDILFWVINRWDTITTTLTNQVATPSN